MNLNEYNAPLPDLGSALKRIGLNPDEFNKNLHPELPQSPSDYSCPHNKESLDKVVHNCLLNVLFENLDTFDLKQEVSLKIKDIFEKIVTNHRGGYCFEINAFLHGIIEGLGFHCYPVAQRILLDGDFPPLNHRAIVVILPDGKRAVCDCGFAGPAPVTSIYLDETEPQLSGKYYFRYEHDKVNDTYKMFRIDGDKEFPLILFKDEPFEPIDFVLLNAYMTYNKNSRFFKNRVVNLFRDEGSISIDNKILCIHENGLKIELPVLDSNSRKEAYIEYFNIPEESLLKF